MIEFLKRFLRKDNHKKVSICKKSTSYDSGYVLGDKKIILISTTDNENGFYATIKLDFLSGRNEILDGIYINVYNSRNTMMTHYASYNEMAHFVLYNWSSSIDFAYSPELLIKELRKNKKNSKVKKFTDELIKNEILKTVFNEIFKASGL